MKEIGVGVVGCGFVGRSAHVPALGGIEGVKVAALADPDAKRRNSADKYSPGAKYEDYADMMKDPNVDAVIVAVPTPMHAKVAIAAMKAGKHVICEMPLANDLDEVDEMIDVSKKEGVILMPSLTFRFTPNYVKAKEMLDSGQIGKPMAAYYREFIPATDLAMQWPPGAWVWNIEESGGPLYTLAVWSIDLLRWLFDSEITEVHGSANYTPLEKTGGTMGYDACGSIKFANGMMGCLQYSGSVDHSSSTSLLEVIGDTTKVLTATDNDLVTLLGDSPTKTEWNVKEPGCKMWGHYQQDEYFCNCIRNGETPSVTPEDGRKAMEVAVEIAKANPGSA